MIKNIKKSIMGTVEFDAQFKGMRKPQDFIVYPISADDSASRIKVQSDTRIGFVTLDTGHVIMSSSIGSGAHNQHLAQAKLIDTLTAEELLLLKANIFSSASDKAGNNGAVHVDNSGAIDIFSL